MNKKKQSQLATATKECSNNRSQSIWRRLRAMFGHSCNDLLPSNRVFQHLNLKEFRDLGRQTVPLQKIVGSSGRHLEFDLSFRPLRGKSDRWLRVAQADGSKLPPVALFKVGEAYFIEDGNHRVSVARANGRERIEAYVIEIDPSPLQPEPSCQRLGYRV
jgi:hypothetical protein